MNANNSVLQNNIKESTRFEIVQLKNEIKTEVKESVNEALCDVNSKISRLESLNEEKDELIKQKNYKITNLELELRKRNIVIYKLYEDETVENNLEQKICKLLHDVAQLEVSSDNIENSFRMGKLYPNSKKTRPVLVSFVSLKTKNLVMQNLKKIVEAGYGISEDFPKEIGEH